MFQCTVTVAPFAHIIPFDFAASTKFNNQNFNYPGYCTKCHKRIQDVKY